MTIHNFVMIYLFCFEYNFITLSSVQSYYIDLRTCLRFND